MSIEPDTSIETFTGNLGGFENNSNVNDQFAPDHAFLTATNMIGEAKSTQRHAYAFEKTVAGKEIQDRYFHMNELCSNLDVLVKKMMEDQESSFFLAYKEHMKKVLREFDALKHKADEEEARARYDVKIRSLEDEVDWFTKEALRLDELSKLYKKEWDKWRTQAEALDEDKKFLEGQLKAMKKENHTLRAAIERAQTTIANNLLMQQQQSQQLQTTSVNATTPNLKKGNLSSRVGSAILPAIPSALPPSTNGSISGLSSDHQNEHPSNVNSYAMSPGSKNNVSLRPEQEQRYLDIIASLKAQLEREQKSNRSLRTSRTTAYAEKSELEEFFLKCVDEVRRDIVLRKRTSVNNMLKRSSSSPEENPPAIKAGLENFTTGDRRKVVELFLTSDDVLVFLYEKLFPHRTGGGGISNSGAANRFIPPQQQMLTNGSSQQKKARAPIFPLRSPDDTSPLVVGDGGGNNKNNNMSISGEDMILLSGGITLDGGLMLENSSIDGVMLNNNSQQHDANHLNAGVGSVGHGGHTTSSSNHFNVKSGFYARNNAADVSPQEEGSEFVE